MLKNPGESFSEVAEAPQAASTSRSGLVCVHMCLYIYIYIYIYMYPYMSVYVQICPYMSMMSHDEYSLFTRQLFLLELGRQ